MVAALAFFAYNVCEVILKGDRMGEVPHLLQRHGYRIIGTKTATTPETLSSAQRAFTTDFHGYSAVAYLADGWTHVEDERLELPKDKALWTAWTKERDARVVGWTINGQWSTRSLRVYERGKLVREVVTGMDRKFQPTVEGSGPPLPEEKGVDWKDFNPNVFLGLLKRLGTPYRLNEPKLCYVVYGVIKP